MFDAVPPSILIADDDPGIRQLLLRMLALEGYRVGAVSNGRDALTVIGSEHPNLLLLDLTMPVLDGWEVYRRLHEQGERPHLVIIIITAGESLHHVHEVFPDAVVMAKPFEMDELLETIAHQLQSLDADESPA